MFLLLFAGERDGEKTQSVAVEIYRQEKIWRSKLLLHPGSHTSMHRAAQTKLPRVFAHFSTEKNSETQAGVRAELKRNTSPLIHILRRCQLSQDPILFTRPAKLNLHLEVLWFKNPLPFPTVMCYKLSILYFSSAV